MTLIAQRTITGAEVCSDLRLKDRRRRKLSTIVRRQADHTRPFIVSVHRIGQPVAANDLDVVLRSEWDERRVGSHDIVLITYLPRGGGQGGGASILMAVAAIALSIIVPFAIGALGAPFAAAGGGLTMLGKLVSTGIIMGGMALLSHAFKPKANKPEEEKPIYGVSGGGNLPRPGDRIPRLYGKCWTVPDLSQPDYFVYEGENQILYKLMTVTLGKAKIHKIRIGDQLMWTDTGGIREPFAGSRVEIVNPGEKCSLVPRGIVTSSAVQGLELPRPDNVLGTWSGPFVISAPGVTVNKIQIDLSAPQGAMTNYVNSKGAQEGPAAIGWEFQYAQVNDTGGVVGPWKTLDWFGQEMKSRRPLRFTRIFSVPEGRYAVRGRNNYNNTPFNDRVSNVSNALNWDALRGHTPDSTVRSKVTQVAIVVRSNAALGVTSFADVQIEATGIIPVWNGSAWVEQATRKAVWVYADVMRNTVYGGGIPDSAFDKETAKFYADTVNRYDTFDGVIRGPDSVWNVACAVLLPFRSEPVHMGRIWSLVRDNPTDARRHVISSRQIVKGSSGIAFDTDPDDGSAHVVADYHLAGDPKRPIELPDIYYGTKSITPTRRHLFGVTGDGHARHIARWLAASAFFRRQTVRFTTEHDARIYKRGDSIAVEIWFASKAKPVGILAVTGNTLILDRNVPYTPGDHLIIRDRSGREWGPVALAGQGGASDELALDAGSRALVESQTGLPLGSVLALSNMEATTALIGPVTFLQRNYLVKSAKPSGRDRIDVEAVIDAPQVWAEIGATEEESPNDEGRPTEDIPPPTNFAFAERVYIDDTGKPGNAATVSWTKSIDWRALLYEVEYRVQPGSVVDSWRDPDVTIETSATDGFWLPAGATAGSSIDIDDLPPSTVDFRVRAVYTALEGSVWVYLRNVPVLGLQAPPPDITGFAASVVGDYMRLTWDAAASPILSHYEVRFSPQMSGVTWGSAVPLVEKTTATTEQVPAAVGTYLVKAVTTQGILSRNPAAIVSNVAAISKLNAVEELLESPTFPGVKTGIVVNGGLGGLQLGYADNIFGRSNWFFSGDFFLGFATGIGLYGEGIYSFAQSVDLGAVFTSRLSALVDAFGLNLSTNMFIWTDVFDREDFFQTEPAATWDARLEYRSTNGNPSDAPIWSEWKQVIVGDVTARAFQFRLRLMSYQFGISPIVRRLEVSVDMPDRHEGGDDLAAPVAGLRVEFIPPFLGLKGLGITAQGMQTGDRYEITNKDETGFNIRFFNSNDFFNSAGTAVARTFDFVAVGFGRKET